MKSYARLALWTWISAGYCGWHITRNHAAYAAVWGIWFGMALVATIVDHAVDKGEM